ncbi:hypothetical protein [uncultured Muribaculum sp.]|nr:hypothetical protein [uncultured Muribaculum sp.]
MSKLWFNAMRDMSRIVMSSPSATDIILMALEFPGPDMARHE